MEQNPLLKYLPILHPDLIFLAKIIRKRLHLDYDLVIAITGEVGIGKSTLAIILAILIDPQFTLTQISHVPDAKEIIKKFTSLNKYQVFMVDEAVRGFHKYDWQTRIQQTIVKMYSTERWQNKATIVIMPRFQNFTSSFRNDRIKIWIHVIDRGVAISFIKDDKDKNNPDPWHFEDDINLKKRLLKRKKVIDLTTDKILQIERQTKNYMYDFTFPDLPKPIKEEYITLKIQSRKEVDYTEQTNQDQRLQLLKDELNKYKAITYNILKEHGIIQNIKDMGDLYQETERNLKEKFRKAYQTLGKPTTTQTLKLKLDHLQSQTPPTLQEEEKDKEQGTSNQDNIIILEKQEENKPEKD